MRENKNRKGRRKIRFAAVFLIANILGISLIGGGDMGLSQED